MGSRRHSIISTLADLSMTIETFTSNMRAASDGDNGATAYRSLGSAPGGAEPTDIGAYEFLKNPPPEKIKEYYENVSNLVNKICMLKSSISSDKTVPNLDDEINLESQYWFGYEMCMTALGNIEKLKASLADDSGDGCPICMEQSVKDAQFTTVCGHKFCNPCWDAWKMALIHRTLTCPLCRKEQPRSEYDPTMLPPGLEPSDEVPQYRPLRNLSDGYLDEEAQYRPLRNEEMFGGYEVPEYRSLRNGSMQEESPYRSINRSM